jgi:hypothetical protein
MANNKSDYLEGKIIEHVLRNVAYTSPVTVYLALYTAAAGETGGGTEVSGGSYARVAITFGAQSGGTVLNSTDLLFTTATGAWGTITDFGIMDALTVGNLLYYGPLSASQAITTGQQAKFATGSISVSEL